MPLAYLYLGYLQMVRVRLRGGQILKVLQKLFLIGKLLCQKTNYQKSFVSFRFALKRFLQNIGRWVVIFHSYLISYYRLGLCTYMLTIALRMNSDYTC